jgi:hypothetical protein
LVDEPVVGVDRDVEGVFALRRGEGQRREMGDRG